MNELPESYRKHRKFYEDAIRLFVCSRCVDFGEDGSCYTEDPEGCAIYRWLPELVSIAERIRDTKMDSYIDAVRNEICAQCKANTSDGRCWLRDKIDCGLDRYLELVFEAIEDVQYYIRTHPEKEEAA